MPNNPFPDDNIILMHPDARAIRALPPNEARTRMLTELSEQEKAPVPDLERVMGLGQLAFLMQLPDFDPDLERWLEAHPSKNGLDATGLFVGGYWQKGKEPSKSLVLRLIKALDQYSLAPLEVVASTEPALPAMGLVDTLVLAIGAAYANTKEAALRQQIKATFQPLHSIAPYMQSASRSDFELVTGVPVPKPPLPFPPELYRAYEFEEGTEHFYLIEHRTTEKPVLRVSAVILNGHELTVKYRALNPALNDRLAQPLIVQCLLVDFLHDFYRGRASLVYCENEASKSRASSLYPD